MRRLILCLPLLAFLGFLLPLSGQNIRINEIMSSNATTLADEEGDYSDWIELYNFGNEDVSLAGWGLSDNPGNPFKWVFPRVTLGAGKYMLVWASGKNLRPPTGDWVNGIRREVYPDITGTTVIALTQHYTYPHQPGVRQLIKNYFEAPVDESNNYGQRMHGYLRAPASGSYTFYLSSDDNGQLWLSSDTTAGKLQLIAEVPSWTKYREWTKYPGQRSAPVILEEGKYYYIMALAKEGTGGDNLAAGWERPDGKAEFPIRGEHLFWTEGELHTSFSISSEGETLVLTNPQGVKVSEMAAVTLPSGLSWGTVQDGGTGWAYFDQPTPGQANTTARYSEILSPPQFSHPGGFYGTPFDLKLTSSQQGVTIVYSIDGSLPAAENLGGQSYSYKNQYRKDPGSMAGPFLYRSYRSYAYNNPLRITDRSGEANQVSRISSTYDRDPWYLPSEPVDKAVVVKARAVKAGALPSGMVSHTYFIRNGGTNPYPLPVISLSAQEDDLFDFNHGIYVAGSDFENWRTSNPSGTANGGVPANYHREGDDWEFPAHIELFDAAGNRFLGQQVGFRIHGNWSNSNPFKSLRIYARNEYGKQYLDYPFFNNRSYTAYKRIILRNSGNDIWYTLFRDAAMQEMVSHLNFETQAYQPSVLFINGEYWGIHNIRERVDKYFLSAKFGVNEEQLDILEGNAVVDEGENQHYKEILDYISLNGVRKDADYAWVKSRMDTESFMDYMIAQIFMVNTDWPGNNIKYWRLQIPEFLPAAGQGKDGRWRWIMFDADYTFGIYRPEEYSYDMMYFTTRIDGPDWPNPPWSTFLFRKMLENENFRTGFVVRFCDQLNTAFLPEAVTGIINGMKAAIEPEMTRQIQRWKIPSSVSTWNNNISLMQNFARQRPGYARVHLRNHFGLTSNYTLTVNVSGKQQGHVVVNTIALTGDTPGVAADPYPWQGMYFRYLPLRLAAVPAPGYTFVRWESGNQTYSDSILEVRPDGDRYFTAIFREEGVTAVEDQMVSGEEGQGILGEVYPNPFTGMATLRLKTGRGGEVSMVLSDLQGRSVQQVYSGYVPRGTFSCPVDGTGLAPGIYFLVCETPDGVFRQKIVRAQP